MNGISATQLIASRQPESSPHYFIRDGESSQVCPVFFQLLLKPGQFFFIQFFGHLLPGQSGSHLDLTQN